MDVGSNTKVRPLLDPSDRSVSNASIATLTNLAVVSWRTQRSVTSSHSSCIGNDNNGGCVVIQ